MSKQSKTLKNNFKTQIQRTLLKLFSVCAVICNPNMTHLQEAKTDWLKVRTFLQYLTKERKKGNTPG